MIGYGFEHMKRCDVRGCGLLCGPTKSAAAAHKTVHGHYPKFVELQGADDGRTRADPDEGAGGGRPARQPPVRPMRGGRPGDPPPGAPP